MDSHTTQTRKNYNRMSRSYDFIAAPSERRFKDIGIEMLGVQEGMKVLELGCGTGYGLEKFSKRVGDGGVVCGVDLSEGMLVQAQKRISKMASVNLPHIVQADISNLPIREGFFDRVFMSFVLEIFQKDEIQNILISCKRLLKDDGELCIVSIQDGDRIPNRIYKWGHKNFPNIIDCRPIQLEQEILKAGLSIIQQRSERMWGLPIEIISAK